MKKLFFIIIPILTLFSCSSDDGGGNNNGINFDRKELLTSLVNNYITPAVDQYVNNANTLQTNWNTAKENPTTQNIENVLSAYKSIHQSFEAVEVLRIGTIENNDFTTNSNIYPVDKNEIETSITNGGTFNVDLPSAKDEKTLGALDYLFYGNGGLATRINNENYKTYVDIVITDIIKYANLINNKWSDSYKEQFINNDGSGANASVDDFVNQLIFYFEKRVRAGKVGIPAGIYSATVPKPNHTETLYEPNSSRQYLIESLNYFEHLINGENVNGGSAGKSILDYADAVNAKTSSGEKLSTAINNQIKVAKAKVNTLNADLSTQVSTNNTAMIEAFDELQKIVVLLKVDLVQALGITITYVDADGD